MTRDVQVREYGALLGPASKEPGSAFRQANISGEIVHVPEHPPPLGGLPRNAINPPPPESRRGLLRPDEVPPQKWFVAMVVEYDFDDELDDTGPELVDEDECWCEDCEEKRRNNEGPLHLREIYECRHVYRPKILTTRFCEAYPTEAEAEARLRGWVGRHMPGLTLDENLCTPTGSTVLVHLEEVSLWGKEAVEDFIARNRWKLGK